MAVAPGKAAKGQKTHESKPTSKAASFPAYRKPENRHPTTHNYSVGGAESQIRKMG